MTESSQSLTEEALHHVAIQASQHDQPSMPEQVDQPSHAPPAALPGDGLIDLENLTESEWRALVARSFAQGADRMNTTDQLIADNTTLTAEVWEGTAEIRDIVLMGKSFFSGLGKFARGCARVWVFLKPLIQAATVIAGGYAAIRGALGSAFHGHGPTK